MSIYKRRNSKYYYCEIAINGKVVIRSTKTTRKALALRFEAQLRERLYRELILGERPPISLDDAIHFYERSKAASVSQRALKCQVRALKAQLARLMPGSSWLHHISSRHLENIAASRRAEGVAEGTIRVLFSTLKGVLAVSASHGYLTPTDLRFPITRVRNQRTRILSHEEESRLLSVLQMRSVDGFDLVTLLLDTGARLNEIQHLRWQNVDLERQELKLWRPKTRTETVIHLTDRSLSVLTERRRRSGDSELVFPTKSGGLRHDTPKVVQRAYRDAGLIGFCTHCLRHTAASRLVQGGMTLYAVSKFLGHSNARMTERYAHLEHQAVAAQARAILNGKYRN